MLRLSSNNQFSIGFKIVSEKNQYFDNISQMVTKINRAGQAKDNCAFLYTILTWFGSDGEVFYRISTGNGLSPTYAEMV
jgi:hypothetical protein